MVKLLLRLALSCPVMPGRACPAGRVHTALPSHNPRGCIYAVRPAPWSVQESSAPIRSRPAGAKSITLAQSCNQALCLGVSTRHHSSATCIS